MPKPVDYWYCCGYDKEGRRTHPENRRKVGEVTMGATRNKGDFPPRCPACGAQMGTYTKYEGR